MTILELETIIKASRQKLGVHFIVDSISIGKMKLLVSIPYMFGHDVWETVYTARGDEKIYCSMDAAIRDIDRLNPDFSGSVVYRIIPQNKSKNDN